MERNEARPIAYIHADMNLKNAWLALGIQHASVSKSALNHHSHFLA